MDVINENSAILSNFEVYSMLNDIRNGQNGRRKPGNDQHHLATITFETLNYLKNTPAAYQNPEVVSQFASRLAKFKLTKAELLQLLNHRPTSLVELQLLIEENEERLSEEEMYELIDVVKSSLPGPPGEESVDTAAHG